jgi:hypothetical protein
MYLPFRENVGNITLNNNTKYCYRDVPVFIHQNNNKKILAFLNKEMIMVSFSKKILSDQTSNELRIIVSHIIESIGMNTS